MLSLRTAVSVSQPRAFCAPGWDGARGAPKNTATGRAKITAPPPRRSALSVLLPQMPFVLREEEAQLKTNPPPPQRPQKSAFGSASPPRRAPLAARGASGPFDVRDRALFGVGPPSPPGNGDGLPPGAQRGCGPSPSPRSPLVCGLFIYLLGGEG